jgi:trehalose 6-phosphate phosphatase
VTAASAARALEAIRSSRARAGIFLDFDGTLAPIVPRPEDARIVRGARSVLGRLTARYGLVAVLSGRPTRHLKRLVDVRHVACVGLYGLDEAPPAAAVRGAIPEVHAISESVPGTWVEDKGATVAVHYRQAPDRAAARRALLEQLEELAETSALLLAEGKSVIEMFPTGALGKGTVLQHMALERRLAALLVAGDDLADMDSFHAARRLQAGGMTVVAVGVAGAETPRALIRAADLHVDGPTGLVRLLRRLL